MIWTIIVLAGLPVALAVYLYRIGRKYDRIVAAGTFAWATTHLPPVSDCFPYDDLYGEIGIGKPYRVYPACTTTVHFADGGHCLLRGAVTVPFPSNTFIIVRQNVFGDSRIDRLDDK